MPGVDRGLIDQLHADGTHTVDQLLERFDEDSLAAFERPRGGRMQPGRRGGAERILKSAEAHQRGEPVLLAEARAARREDLGHVRPRGHARHASTDIEKIYIWGLQLFGEDAGPFRPALAGFGADGDREGWHAFLAECDSIFSEHGDLPFVHWATYERVKIDMYISRYGDDQTGTAARVKENLLDLLPITRAAVAVPLSSYSLKDVETLTGYERQLEEYGGDWSMAKYIEATETRTTGRARGAHGRDPRLQPRGSGGDLGGAGVVASAGPHCQDLTWSVFRPAELVALGSFGAQTTGLGNFGSAAHRQVLGVG